MNAGDKVWLDGAVIASTEARVSVSDRGFSLGDGLFETMLWTGEAIRFATDHVARLSHGAAFLGIPMPLSGPALLDALATLAAANGLEGQTAALRLTLSRGDGTRGLAPPDSPRPLLLATSSPYAPPAAAARLVRVGITRTAGSVSARFKTLSYVDSVAALREAQAKGADEAIVCNALGRPVCAAAANLVVVLRGQAVTPPISDGALPGVVRGRLIAAGLLTERELEPEDLSQAEAIALTNALVGVRPVSACDGRDLPILHPVIAALRDAINPP